MRSAIGVPTRKPARLQGQIGHPNFKVVVLGRMILFPLDLKRNLTTGDIMHGHLSLDQLWAARPVLGNAGYRALIKDLYMGGGLSGNPGRNAALEILRNVWSPRLAIDSVDDEVRRPPTDAGLAAGRGTPIAQVGLGLLGQTAQKVADLDA